MYKIINFILAGIFISLILIGLNFTKNEDYTLLVNSVANETVLVYNINRNEIDFQWEGGSLGLVIGDTATKLYVARDIINIDSKIFADDRTLVIDESCTIIQIKIDLKLAQIQNNLVAIYFDDNYKPLHIIREFKCF